MFAAIRTELAIRFVVANEHLTLIQDLEHNAILGQRSNLQSRIHKGLMFVLLYAMYEYCLQQCVQTTIREFNALQIATCNLKPDVLAAVLDSHCLSLNNLAARNSWNRRSEMFSASREGTPARINEDFFPTDDSHMRSSQLLTIWRVFQIATPTLPHLRYIGLINEIVESRNAVAHGREAPERLGGRFTYADMQRRLSDTNILCEHVISQMESHCMNINNFC